MLATADSTYDASFSTGITYDTPCGLCTTRQVIRTRAVTAAAAAPAGLVGMATWGALSDRQRPPVTPDRATRVDRAAGPPCRAGRRSPARPVRRRRGTRRG